MKEYDCGKDENKYAGWNCPLNQLESLVWLCGKNAGVEKQKKKRRLREQWMIKIKDSISKPTRLNMRKAALDK